MNRRKFIKRAAQAVAGAAVAPAVIPKALAATPQQPKLVPFWIETKRVDRRVSKDYEQALQAAFARSFFLGEPIPKWVPESSSD